MRAKRGAIQADIGSLLGDLRKKYASFLAGLVTEKEEELANIKDELQRAEAEAANPISATWENAVGLMEALEQAGEDGRLRLKAALLPFISFDHPEEDDVLPPESHVYFQIVGEEEPNRYSRELAEKQLRAEGRPLMCVKVKCLAPPQSSRLIDPVIEPVHAVV